MTQTQLSPTLHTAIEYAQQAEKLSLEGHPSHDPTQSPDEGTAVAAKFITPLDPVIETANGDRLPAIPVYEAHKLNVLKDRVEHGARQRPNRTRKVQDGERDTDGETAARTTSRQVKGHNTDDEEPLESLMPSWRTHPLFPPLPLYGPPSRLRDLQCLQFRCTSAVLSTCFLLVIVLGSLFTSIPTLFWYVWMWLTFRDADAGRPFIEEELRRAEERKEKERAWVRTRKDEQRAKGKDVNSGKNQETSLYEPTEGGPDKLLCDIGYYARRVGLDAEEFRIQTEDGFVISLFHIYNPKEYIPVPEEERTASEPTSFTNEVNENHDSVKKQFKDGSRRYPVLLVHGLLQSAGAYCTNDDDSLAFFLCKSGYDVWLGNNRCGFNPRHTLLKPKDPRMWAWNIRQMGVMDLPAMMSRVLEETGFEKLGLVCHSQGTTETFVALAKEQRPDLGEKISVFCALAPAVYAGPLIGKMYFKFMRVISPAMFRVWFGIHGFIPLMMFMHKHLPGKLYGWMGYRVFSFLFSWSDTRWDRGLRARLFRFSPVWVSSESMRWWLGRECFAKQKCILATREEETWDEDGESDEEDSSDGEDKGNTAWYDEQAPPMAFWVAGSDELVDGRRLLRRFARGREPFVRVVHQRVIEEYEHLDVLWAMDAVEKVGMEVRKVLWDTMPEEARKVCRRIEGV
jgi:pimeloyl-ACP methyl ester carboxylesterase